MDLKQIIDNECYIVCSFLSTERFITYCKNRGINTSRKHLEQLEKLEIFYPMVRVSFPKGKRKIEYIDGKQQYRDLGPLNVDEEWPGDTKEEYAHFWFEKKYALNWFENEILWSPRTRPFQEWESFKDEQGHTKIESYYSLFQCHTLYELVNMTTFKIGAEWWCTSDEATKQTKITQISKWGNEFVKLHQDGKWRCDLVALTCQAISNRYYLKTQTDRRTINISYSAPYHEGVWDWYQYCQNWDARDALKQLGLTIEDLKNQHCIVSGNSASCDPLENWYHLVSFVAIEKKRLLKGKALLAQTFYSMEHMLRLFYEELTGDKLHPPGESSEECRVNISGQTVIENEMKYLQFLANDYHLNPKPKLILIVEGEGEYQEIPRLSTQLLGYEFSKLGIEILDIRGIGGYTGQEAVDPYGALEKFIDYHHYWQTIVFIVLDNEGRAQQITQKLLKATSKFVPYRSLINSDYIYLWGKKNIEFSNFTSEEIAAAMTQVGENRYNFQVSEIEKCFKDSMKEDKPTLSNLYKERLSYKLPKKVLLKILFDKIIVSTNRERPVIDLLKKIINLAALNHQPVSEDIWESNQKSGHLGKLNT